MFAAATLASSRRRTTATTDTIAIIGTIGITIITATIAGGNARAIVAVMHRAGSANSTRNRLSLFLIDCAMLPSPSL